MTEVDRKPTWQSGVKSKKAKRGRPKATEISVHSRKHLSALLQRLTLPDTILTYRAAAVEMTRRSGVAISVATIYRLAHGQRPKSLHLRRALGLGGKRGLQERIDRALAYDYDTWRAAHMAELERIVAWAETHEG